MAFFITMLKEGFMNQIVRIAGQMLVFTLLLATLVAAPAFAESGLTKIADNVYSYVNVRNAAPGNSYGANAGIVIGRDGVVVIDTLISAKEAQRLIRDIRAITDKPIKYVINTHYHLDHVLGNAEFTKLGAVVISQEKDKANLAEKGPTTLKNYRNYGLTESDMEGTVIAVPTLSFTDRMKIDLGDLSMELIAVENSHTGGSLFVAVADRKVVFAGDVLFTGYHPYMAEGNIKGWLAALDKLAALRATAIIPGHGPISTLKDVAEMKAYLVLFDKKARQLAGKSKDVERMYAELKKVLPERPEGDFLIRSNIQLRYVKK